MIDDITLEDLDNIDINLLLQIDTKDDFEDLKIKLGEDTVNLLLTPNFSLTRERIKQYNLTEQQLKLIKNKRINLKDKRYHQRRNEKIAKWRSYKYKYNELEKKINESDRLCHQYEVQKLESDNKCKSLENTIKELELNKLEQEYTIQNFSNQCKSLENTIKELELNKLEQEYTIQNVSNQCILLENIIQELQSRNQTNQILLEQLNQLSIKMYLLNKYLLLLKNVEYLL